jgi:mono/diheme cytochrome c family protein
MNAQPNTFRFTVLGKLICMIGLVAYVGGGIFVLEALAQDKSRSQQGPDYWQPGWMQRNMWAPGSMRPNTRARMQRHWTFMNVGIPSDYVRARSPYKATTKVIQEGHALYAKHCAACHGTDGKVEGKIGESLSPSPALLGYLIQHPIAVDPYLLWSISEGGSAFGTSMPAFKDTLGRDEIWKVIAYMRAGFPQSAKKAQ